MQQQLVNCNSVKKYISVFSWTHKDFSLEFWPRYFIQCSQLYIYWFHAYKTDSLCKSLYSSMYKLYVLYIAFKI